MPAENVKYKGRLQPGRMLLIDTKEGRIVEDEELKNTLCSEKPYSKWLEEFMVNIDDLEEPEAGDEKVDYDHNEMIRRQRVFGYTFEELKVLIGPMAKDAVEPVGAMGVDTPIAVLSDKPKLLYSYFKQLFAQVTNPAIDAYREELITDTRAQLGSEKDLINPSADSCRKIELDHPFLTNKSLKKIKYIDN